MKRKTRLRCWMRPKRRLSIRPPSPDEDRTVRLLIAGYCYHAGWGKLRTIRAPRPPALNRGQPDRVARERLDVCDYAGRD
jgi:hypothetical protein